MTVLALEMSGYHNGVSKLHGEVSRKMWSWLWPKKYRRSAHYLRYQRHPHRNLVAPELKALFDKCLDKDWVFRLMTRICGTRFCLYPTKNFGGDQRAAGRAG
jgi:starch phosphorylase